MATDSGRDASVRSRMSAPHILPANPRRRLLAALPLAFAVAAIAPPFAQATVSVSDAQVNERDGSATFVVTRRAALLAPAIQISYRTQDIPAKAPAHAPSDYIHTQGALSFRGSLLGETQTASVTVQIVDDQIPEDTEHFEVIIAGKEVVGSSGLGRVIDDDPPAPSGRGTATNFVDQLLIARAADGGPPNGPTTEPVISWDARTGRYVAYSSTATNITRGTDGKRNVFVVRRGGRPGKYGTPWRYGSTILASAGMGGAPANGASSSPALDGWTTGDRPHRPTCVAFVSEASNLVAGDTNNQADVFVRKLRGNKLKRIASPPGRPASEVAVAGDCRTIAMVAGGGLYAKRGNRKPRKIAGGGVSAPSLSFNGKQISYAQAGRVFARRIGGRGRSVARGAEPTSDHGGPGGKLRKVAYHRGSHAFWASVRGREHRIGPGSMPTMTAGGMHVMFANGPFVYLYAVSNEFGKKRPQGYCPAGQGQVNDLFTSSRGNYIVFSCSGGNAYLTYIGPK